MISPLPGSTLGGATQTFTWDTGVNVSSYWLWIGTAPGAMNLYDASQGTNTSVMVNNLPTNGRTLYVRLFSFIDGALQYHDYTYTACQTSGTLASMSSPAPGATLPGASATFTWTAGAGVTSYWLWVGTLPGSQNLYDANQGTSTSATVNNLPLTDNGLTLYVRLFSNINGTLLYNDYTYQAYVRPPAPASMISPAPGSLVSNSTTFTWSPGTKVSSYWLWVGTAYRANNLYDANQGQNTAVTISGLPSTGITLYVRLWSLINGTFQFNDYSYVTEGGVVQTSIPALAVGPPARDSFTKNTAPARLVVTNSGTADEALGQDILRLYADYDGTDDRPSVRVDAGGHVHIQRELTLSDNPNTLHVFPNPNYMLGIKSDEEPQDPLIALMPNLSTAFDFTNQALILGFDTSKVPSFTVLASGKMGVGNGAPEVSGSGKFHHSGDTIRVVDQTRTPVSSTDTCNIGEMSFDSSYIYVCVAANTWKRAALSSF